MVVSHVKPYEYEIVSRHYACNSDSTVKGSHLALNLNLSISFCFECWNNINCYQHVRYHGLFRGLSLQTSLLPFFFLFFTQLQTCQINTDLKEHAEKHEAVRFKRWENWRITIDYSWIIRRIIHCEWLICLLLAFSCALLEECNFPRWFTARMTYSDIHRRQWQFPLYFRAINNCHVCHIGVCSLGSSRSLGGLLPMKIVMESVSRGVLPNTLADCTFFGITKFT